MKVDVSLMVLRYTSCCTRRSTATTTVFCIFAFTTVPTWVFRWPTLMALSADPATASFFSVFAISLLSCLRGVDRALAEHRLHPRDVAAGLADLQRVVELADGLLEAQLEELLVQLALLRRQLIGAQLPDLFRLHYATSASNRFTNLVLMESLWAARRSASRASFSGMPSIS